MSACPSLRRAARALAAAAALAAAGAPAPAQESQTVAPRPGAWSAYGGDPGGMRYSPLADITRENVSRLEIAWVHRTGDVSDGRGAVRSTTAYEATPILVGDTLYLCSPMNRVFALDAQTGAERWVYDPGIDLSVNYANQLVCRGVASWRDPGAGGSEGAAREGPTSCRHRIFTATNDARLIALDARSGRPCAEFGEGGAVDLARDVGALRWPGEYQVTSPPVVVQDIVVVGSAVADNQRIDAPSGVVRAFDARTGALRWSWDPIPAGAEPPGGRAAYALGTANVWAPMSADPERDLLFVPTGNTSPDYYGGHRRDTDAYASAVVALRASTGEVVWHFQTVHHDLWDFDVPAQPTLASVPRDGRELPAVIQATKMGLLFVLHRETGQPLFGVDERPVPQAAVPGETVSPTQPFPRKPPPLAAMELRPEDAWGFTPWDRGRCRKRIAALRNEGIYTPPSLEGSLMFPGNAGGSNWGGIAVDPERRLAFANVSNLAWTVRLLPAEAFARERAANPGVEISPQEGTPYAMRREVLLSPFGVPCNPPPWGTLAAVDLASGDIRWQVTLGTIRDIAPFPISLGLGTPNTGGPLATGGGLVFVGAAMDDYLRAFDADTGEEVWKGRLPAGGQATPMTYRAPDGRQLVVIAAGGHGRAGTRLGDHLVAFALPD